MAVSMTSSLPLAQAVFSTKVLMKLYTRNRHTKICIEDHTEGNRETGGRGERGENLSHKANFISEGLLTILKMKIAIIGNISREDPVEAGRGERCN